MTAKAHTGGRALVDALVDQGVDRIFCVPGESYLAALDALYDVGDKIQVISCRHEAAAANMAEAYGKLTGRPGVCFVTRGPGALHAAIGIHTAWQDSTPLVLLIGQVASDQQDREAFQEVDYRRLFSDQTKWVGQVDRADRLAEYVGHAFMTATAGRMGPVALSLPEDMLSGPAPRQKTRTHPPVRPYPDPDKVEHMLGMLGQAKRPLVILGGSGWTSGAVADMTAFLAANDLPACTSFRCQDLIDNRHPCFVGDLGIGANPALVQRLRDSDLVLAIGPRLGEMTTGGYNRLRVPVPDQPLIHVHAGAEELGRVYQADLMINADPRALARGLRPAALPESRSRSQWRADARADYEAWIEPVRNPGPVQISQIYAYLRTRLPTDSIVANGAGNYAGWLHRFYQYRGFRTQLAPTNGAMGYGVPAAIAAALTAPDRTVVGISGDGCFLMNSQDLITLVHHKAKAIFLVFNNGMYGTIRMHQERDYPARTIGTTLKNPDFCAYGQSFGLLTTRVTKTEEFKPAFERALSAEQPSLIEIIVDPNAISPTQTLEGLRTR